jgi:hypothetical protein
MGEFLRYVLGCLPRFPFFNASMRDANRSPIRSQARADERCDKRNGKHHD